MYWTSFLRIKNFLKIQILFLKYKKKFNSLVEENKLNILREDISSTNPLTEDFSEVNISIQPTSVVIQEVQPLE